MNVSLDIKQSFLSILEAYRNTEVSQWNLRDILWNKLSEAVKVAMREGIVVRIPNDEIPEIAKIGGQFHVSEYGIYIWGSGVDSTSCYILVGYNQHI
jgi:hypothetical protein